MAKLKHGEAQEFLWDAAACLSAECLIWPSQAGSRPTVVFRGRPMNASRAVWMMATNSDPGDDWVLHSCGEGERGCVNLRHLYLGDATDNARDMWNKHKSRTYAPVPIEKRGRGAEKRRGSGNGRVVMTEEQVREMRHLYSQGWRQADLGASFGVTQTAVSAIVRRVTWSHV